MTSSQIQKSPVAFVALAMLGTASSASALDMPDLPQHYLSTIIAQGNQAPRAEASKERSMGVCYGVYNPPDREYPSLLSPESSAADYFGLYENRTVNVPPPSNIELVIPPKHGKVIYSKYEDELFHPTYIPAPSYVGDEEMVFRVHVDGTTVKLVYRLVVTRVVTGGQVSDDVFCKKTGTQWKISLWNTGLLLSHGAQQGAPGDAKNRRA